MIPAIDTEMMIYALLTISVIMLFWITLLEYRIHRLLRGKNGRDLESTILSLLKNQNETKSFQDELHDYLRNVERRLKRSIQGIDTIRFNPFKGDGSGGNQSFSTAFLNEEGDGVVISSLFARERVHTYSKPIKKFESDFELTNEEKEAIKNVKSNMIGKK